MKSERAEVLDITTRLAIAAGIEALRDAGIPLVMGYKQTSTGSYLPQRWTETYATADIIAYDGEPRVKVGREFLLRKDAPDRTAE